MLYLKMKGKTSKEFNLLITGHDRDLFAEIRDEYFEIPGMPGNMQQSKEPGNKNIMVEFTLQAEDEKDLQIKMRNIKKWLISRDEVEIEFDDEPGIYYIGKVTSFTNPDFDRPFSEFQVIFTMQPYSVSNYLTTEKHSGNTVSEEDVFKVVSDGTAESEFILKVTPQTELSELKIVINDIELIYKARLQAGQTLLINTHDFMAHVGQENVTLDLEGEFPLIEPGANDIIFKSNKTFSYTAEVEFNSRFL